MAFCMNCGHQIPDGAKFCANCGTAAGNVSAGGSQRKTVYEGEIHKCPICGEILNSFVTVCPTCGHELRGTRSSDSIDAFASRLIEAKTDSQKIALIRNFPIPNNKEDIFEYIILASSNIDFSQNDTLSEAWLIKLNQAFQKAQLSFANTPDFERIQSIYTQTQKRIKQQKNAANTQQVVGTVKKTIGKSISAAPRLVSIIARVLAKNFLLVLSMLAFIKAIQVDHIGDNSVGFEILGCILLVFSAVILIRKNTSFGSFALVTGAALLCFQIAKLFDNGVLLRLAGGLTLIFVVLIFITRMIEDNSSDKNPQ